MALVLGEASDFETEELNRLIELRPELAAFKLQMQRVHGLLQEVGAGEFEAPVGDWKLPTERRNAVLAAIRGEATVPAATPDVNPSTQQRVSSKRRLRWTLVKVAAGVCVAGFVGAMALPSYFMDEKASSGYMYVASIEVPRSGESLSGGTDLIYGIDVERTVPGTASPQEGSVLFGENRSKSEEALSAIQNTLRTAATLPSPDYLSDDVSYFSTLPEFERPLETVVQSNVDSWRRPSRPTVTIQNGPASTSQAVDSSELIARNSGVRDYKDLRDENGDGVDAKPNTELGSIASTDSPQDDLADRWSVWAARVRAKATAA